jgi:hypothetical protein
MNRVRFHLGAGRHYGHWQIRSGLAVRYVDPDEASLVLRGCRLANAPGVAKRIHGGAHKTPCAWIECESVETRPPQATESGEAVRYNPRVAPHWIFRDANADGTTFALLQTCGRSVLSTSEGE